MKILSKLVSVLFIVSSFTISYAQLPWTKDTNNPVLSGGTTGAWNRHLLWPSVLYNPDSSRYEMWYSGSSAQSPDWRPYNIGFATSINGNHWVKHPNPVLEPTPGTWDAYTVEGQTVIRENGIYKMWYNAWAFSGDAGGIGYATSTDGITWTKDTVNNPVILPSGANWDAGGFGIINILSDSSGYKLYYGGYTSDYQFADIGCATSTDGITWTPDVSNPVLSHGNSGSWDDGTVDRPQVLYINGLYHMWFTGTPPFEASPWHIGWATSVDGITWKKYDDISTTSTLYAESDPVLSPSSGQWDGTWVDGPSVLLEGDSLRMWYNGTRPPVSTNPQRIGHATAPFTAPFTIHVPADYTTIQAAINAAIDGNLVLVANGSYQENINFKGKAITVASHFYIDGDTSNISSTIIDGSSPSNPDSGSVVSFNSGEDTTSVLYGFKITGGSGSQISTMRIGGGVHFYHSGGKIFDCRVTQNIIEGPSILLGAGIGTFSDTGPNLVIIKDCKIDSNRSVGSDNLVLGGGVYIGCNAIIENNIIQANESFYQGNNLNGSAGGGIYAGALIQNFDIIISNNQIIDNMTTSIGGFGAYTAGIDLYGVSLTMTNNVLANNILSSDAGGYGAGLRVAYGGGLISGNAFLFNRSFNTPQLDGGGILLAISNGVQISENYFEGNEGTWGAGIEDYQSTNTTIENNRFINNVSSNWGGAILVESNAIITNNLMNGNSAALGGAIYVYSGTEDKINKDSSINKQAKQLKQRVTLMGKDTDKESLRPSKFTSQLVSNPLLLNNTIVNNAAVSGGAIYISGGSQPILLNSILWGNNNDQILVNSGSIEVHYSNIQSGWQSGAGNIDTDPLFADTLDFHLSDSSICIGSGIDSIEIGGTWYYAPQIDIEGNPRPNPAGSMPDIGAQESSHASPTEIFSKDSDKLPKTFVLKQNYPNPFNPTTTIEFSIPKTEFVSLKIYNLLGQEVVTLDDQKLTPGKYKYIWSASSLASGVYLYKLQAGKFIETKKLILLK